MRALRPDLCNHERDKKRRYCPFCAKEINPKALRSPFHLRFHSFWHQRYGYNFCPFCRTDIRIPVSDAEKRKRLPS